MVMKNNSIVIFSKAARMLAEADTVQKAKELKDMAIVAGEWARRKKMGKEAEEHCRSYALEAERRMGELLKASEKQKPGEHWKKKRLHSVTVTPSLADLGINQA
jgi:hypothetical protein